MTEEQEQGMKRQWFWWRMAVRYGIAAVVFVFFLTTSLHFGYTPDETYIFLQRGKEIAQGGGFSAEAMSQGSGFTASLWVLLIAGGTKLGLDPYIVAKTLDMMFASFSILAILGFAFIVIRDHVYALVAAWMYSFDAWVLRWSGSGLDTSVGTLLTVLALWYTYRKEYIPASLVAALLTLVRVEWGSLFVVILADLIINGSNRSVRLKMTAGSLFVYAVVVGSWVVVSLGLGGTLSGSLPGGTGFGAMLNSPGRLMLRGLTVIGGTQLVMLLALLAGVAVAFKRFGWHAVQDDGLPMLWILLLPLILLLTGQDLGSRALLPVIPLIIVYGAWGVKKIEIGTMMPTRRGLLMLTTVAIISLAQNQVVYHRWIRPHMDNVELGVNECLKPMGYWLRSHAPAGSTVLSPEIGVVGYVSGRKVLPGVREPIERCDYVITRSSSPAVVSVPNMKPVMTRPFPGLAVMKPETSYYTLYEVVRP